MDSRTNRAGSNPYGHIWILTLKRICAEGLQQIMHRAGGGKPDREMRREGDQGNRGLGAVIDCGVRSAECGILKTG